MPVDPAAAALAKKFEPILLFHPSETFFPIDPKFYLERCALWRSKPHARSFFPGGAVQEKKDWGEPTPGFPRRPQLAKGELAVFKNEVTPGQRWLGEIDGSGQSPFLIVPEPPTERPLSEDRFLQLAGWEPFFGAPSEVTATSDNHRPTLDANVYNMALQGSSFWYYAEYFTNQQLLAQFANQSPHGIDLFRAVINNARFSAPRLLVYHFFYALHEEPLRGCAKGDGPTFATFAGEWSSVAILVDSADNPLFIGLTSRNVGDPTSIAGGENRVGMIVRPWKDVDRVSDHPKIFVSHGTHGNYLTAGVHDLAPFTPGDIDLNQGTCGEIETLDDVIPSEDEADDPGSEGFSGWSLALSAIVSIALTFGILWGGLTTGSRFGHAATSPNRKPQDETGGGPLGFSLILRPAGLFVPELSAALRTEEWLTKMPAATDNPRYDFIVDRDTQLWWPPRGRSPGYAGRWGPRVTNDPKDRRSGMRCPPFALMALEGIARL